MSYLSLNKAELQGLIEELRAEYNAYKAKGLKLNVSRGKPDDPQLAIADDILRMDLSASYLSEDGTDCRNYGELEGIPEAKLLFSELLSVPSECIFVGGNSSLSLMFNTIMTAFVKGLAASPKPWGREEKVKFLCPSPGYDRHFAISDFFGLEPVTVPMTGEGPDMDVVERLVSKDASIKGIWCVPVYSNPEGVIFSDRVCERLASMKCAAPDFTIMWDNAYLMHSLYGEEVTQPEMLSLCAEYGNPDRVVEFASTSKITFSGGGISCVAASKGNKAAIVNTMKIKTIGYDKLNMLRHVRFLKNKANVLKVMARHAEILRPKFELVEGIFKDGLEGEGIAAWSTPRGGYFISFNAMEGTAKRVVELCGEAGVQLTAAGATYPQGRDPRDSNIRIAPSFAHMDELTAACELFVICVKLAACEKLLAYS